MSGPTLLNLGRRGLVLALVSPLLIPAVAVIALVSLHHQEAIDRQELVSEAASVVVASAARPGTWVALVQYGDYDGTRGMPLNLPYLPDLDAVAAHRNTERRTLRVDGLHVELLTRPRPGGQVQAILDLSSTDRYRSRLLVAVVAVGLVTGFISAAAARLALSRRTGSPASTPTVS